MLHPAGETIILRVPQPNLILKGVRCVPTTCVWRN